MSRTITRFSALGELSSPFPQDTDVTTPEHILSKGVDALHKSTSCGGQLVGKGTKGRTEERRSTSVKLGDTLQRDERSTGLVYRTTFSPLLLLSLCGCWTTAARASRFARTSVSGRMTAAASGRRAWSRTAVFGGAEHFLTLL